DLPSAAGRRPLLSSLRPHPCRAGRGWRRCSLRRRPFRWRTPPDHVADGILFEWPGIEDRRAAVGENLPKLVGRNLWRLLVGRRHPRTAPRPTNNGGQWGILPKGGRSPIGNRRRQARETRVAQRGGMQCTSI